MAVELPTVAEARALPTFWRVARVSRTVHNCPECAEHRREPWVNGSACDAHTHEEVMPALTQKVSRRTYTANRAHPDAFLALEVLRAGGNPEPRYPAGSVGNAQWTYKRRGRKADRDALVLALTADTRALVAA